jgi:hypothetical protein
VTNSLTQLHRAIVDHLDLEELRKLCFDLGVNYDALRGEGSSGKARELILKIGRRRFMKDEPYRETCPGKLVPGWDE